MTIQRTKGHRGGWYRGRLGTRLATGAIQLGVTALMVSATGCGGGGGGGGNEEPVETIQQPAPAVRAAAVGASRLDLSIIDATSGERVRNTRLTLLSDPLNVAPSAAREQTLAEGEAVIELDEANLADNDQDGMLDRTAVLRFSAESPTTLPTVVEVPVSKVGVNMGVIRLVSQSTPPAGVAVTKQLLSLVEFSSTVSAAAADTPMAASVTLPAESQFISNEGKPLDNSTLEVVVAGYDAGNAAALELFPGGLEASIENLAELNGNETQQRSDPRVTFQSAGFATIKVVDGQGNVAKEVLNGGTAKVRVAVSQNVVNPETGRPVVAGDSIPYFSFDVDRGSWRYEGRLIIAADDDGLFGEFETRHFSSFNLDWYGDGRCDSQPIRVLTESGASASAVGLLSLKLPTYSTSLYYRGDGVLSFYRAPRETVGLSFSGAYGSPVQYEVVRLTNGDGRSIGSLVNGELSGVPLCDLAAAVLVVRPVARKPNFYAYGYSVNEGNGEARQITVYGRLDSASPAPVAVTFNTANNTAVAGSDYVSRSGVLTFPAGETVASFTVDILGDTAAEPWEYFTIGFSSTDAAVYSWSQVIYAGIADDDLPALTLTQATVTENDGAPQTIDLQARFASNVPQWVSLTLTRNNGATTATEYADVISSVGGSATWYPGAPPSNSLGRVVVLGDKDVEGPEEVVYDVRVYPSYFQLPPESRQIRVRIDDDGDVISAGSTPTVTIANPPSLYVEPLEVGEAVGRVFQQVSLSTATDSPVQVRLSSSTGTATAGLDYRTIADTTLDFAPGQATRVIAVDVIDDVANEGGTPETVPLVLRDAVGATIGTGVPRTVAIRDNDGPLIYAYAYLNEDDGVGQSRYDYRFVFAWPPSPETITLELTERDTTGQLAPSPVTVTIPPNTYAVPIPFVANDDNVFEGWQYTALSGRVVAGNAGFYFGNTAGFAYIAPSDVPPLAFVQAAANNRVDQGGSMQFALYFDRPSTRATTVRLVSTGGDARLQLPASIQMPAGQTFVPFAVPVARAATAQPETVVCIGVGDGVGDSDEYRNYFGYANACGTINRSLTGSGG